MGTVVVGALVETLVAEVPLGVEIFLVAANLYDSFVLIQGHDEAAVAATKKAGRNLVLHESPPCMDWGRYRVSPRVSNLE